MKIHEILNKFRWDENFKSKIDDYILIYIHRGAINDEKVIKLTQITKVNKDSFYYKETEYDEETYIPYHRIKMIKSNKTNEIIYEKREKLRNIK